MDSLFKALNDPTRRKILELLRCKPMTAGDIADQFQISKPSISHHLDLLKQADLILAERQGQTAARNMLGRRERFEAVPFFWTEQYDVGLAYVGHAERWDEARIDGDLEARDCSITYSCGGKELAVAAIHRDLAGLRAEVEFERRIAATHLVA